MQSNPYEIYFLWATTDANKQREALLIIKLVNAVEAILAEKDTGRKIPEDVVSLATSVVKNIRDVMSGGGNLQNIAVEDIISIKRLAVLMQVPVKTEEILPFPG